MKYPLHDKALKYAASQVGVHENPPHSNRGPIQKSNPRGGVDFYQDHDFLPGHGYPWCVSFVLTAWELGAGRPLPYRTASAYGLLNWARGAGWAIPSKQLTPGDPVVFNVGAGHCALFEKWVGDDIHTIDGNSSDQVIRRIRHHSQVAGGIHVPEKAAGPPPHVPKPYWVIASSESGHRVLLFSKFATEREILGMMPRLLQKYGKTGITIKRGQERKT